MTTAVLWIGHWRSWCSACNFDADPREKRHKTRLGYDPGDGKGCGARFVAVAAEYTGDSERELVQAMRPDLPWRGWDPA